MLVVAFLASQVAGCGGGGHRSTPRPTPATTSAVTTVPPPQPASLDTGAALTLALGPDPLNWNPLSAQGASADLRAIADQVLPSVFTVQADYSLALNTDLVTSAAETRAEPQTVVYKINPKSVWSDGVPITWADFAYNWEAQSGQARFTDLGRHLFTPVSTVGYQDIVSVAATAGDPYTVTVVFSTAFPDWPSLFADMVPAHVATKVGFDRGFTDPVDDMVSGAPFLVQSYVAGRSLTLVRNQRWWATPASLSSVTCDFVADASVAAIALGAGEVEALALPPTASLLTTIDSLPAVKVVLLPGPEWEELEFNQTGPSGPGDGAEPWLKDPALRQALMLAIDRTQLIADTVGAYAPSTPPLGNRLFVPQEAAYVDHSGGNYNHANLNAAQAALIRAGYTVAGGVLTKSGKAVTLELAASPSALHATEAQFVVAAARQLGIEVSTLDVVPGRGAAEDLAIVDRTASPDLAREVPAVADPRTTGQINYSGADYRAVDTLLARAATSRNPTARIALYNQADADLWRAAESLPLFQLPMLLAYDQRYVGVVANPSTGAPFGDLSRWGVQDRS